MIYLFSSPRDWTSSRDIFLPSSFYSPPLEQPFFVKPPLPHGTQTDRLRIHGVHSLSASRSALYLSSSTQRRIGPRFDSSPVLTDESTCTCVEPNKHDGLSYTRCNSVLNSSFCADFYSSLGFSRSLWDSSTSVLSLSMHSYGMGGPGLEWNIFFASVFSRCFLDGRVLVDSQVKCEHGTLDVSGFWRHSCGDLFFSSRYLLSANLSSW